MKLTAILTLIAALAACGTVPQGVITHHTPGNGSHGVGAQGNSGGRGASGNGAGAASGGMGRR